LVLFDLVLSGLEVLDEFWRQWRSGWVRRSEGPQCDPTHDPTAR
jgi:hypothetical protein